MTKGVSCLHECFTIHPKARLFCKSTSIDLFSNTTKHFSLRIRYVIRHWRFLPGTSVIMFSVKCIVSSTAVSKPSIYGLSPPTHIHYFFSIFIPIMSLSKYVGSCWTEVGNGPFNSMETKGKRTLCKVF